MPTQVVEVNLQTELGSIPSQTFSDLLVVADEPTVSDPTYNEPNVYDTVDQVATDFGDGSDAVAASTEIAAQQADSWWVVMLQSTTHTEDALNSSDTNSVDSFTLSNTPLRGDVSTVSISVDGTAQEVIPTTESPPAQPDPGQTALNFDTGEGRTGEASSGTGSGISAEYDTLDWQSALPEMTAGGFDLAVLAETHADRSYIGELDELVTWGANNDAGVIVAYENGDAYASHEAALTAAHDIGAYIPSGHLLPIAHRSTDDVAAGVAGRVATKRPWFDPFFDGGANYTFSMSNYRESLIGDPNDPNTFEGGDSNHAGPANVLHRVEGTQVLTNSLSTAGRASDYQFWDTKRTEAFVISEVNRTLKSLRLRNEHIPFAPAGKALIEDALRTRLNKYVATGGRALSQEELEDEDALSDEERQRLSEQRIPSGTVPGGTPLSRLEIYVPRFQDLSAADRANRRWSGISIEAQLAGNAHTFEVDLAVQV